MSLRKSNGPLARENTAGRTRLTAQSVMGAEAESRSYAPPADDVVQGKYLRQRPDRRRLELTGIGNP